MSNNPFLTSHFALREIQEFTNLKQPFVQNLNDMQNYSFDICMFMTLRGLSLITSPIDEFGYCSKNFNTLQSFLASMCKKHYKMDLSLIFIFLLNKMVSEEGKDFVYCQTFLKVVEEMSGIRLFHSPNADQVLSLKGGLFLQSYKSGLYEEFRNSRKSFKQLIEILYSPLVKKDLLINKIIVSVDKHLQRLKKKLSNCSISVLDMWRDTLRDLLDVLKRISKSSNTTLFNSLNSKLDLNLSSLFLLYKCSNTSKLVYSSPSITIIENYFKNNSESLTCFKKVENQIFLESLDQDSNKNQVFLKTLLWGFDYKSFNSDFEIYDKESKEIKSILEKLKESNQKESSDDENTKDKNLSNKEIEKYEKVLKSLKREKEEIKIYSDKMNIVLFKLLFDEFNKTSNLKQMFNVDFKFLQNHLMKKIKSSFGEALFAAEFISFIFYLQSDSIMQYLQNIFDTFIFLLPCLLSSTQQQSEFFGVFFKNLIGDIFVILSQQKLKLIIKKNSFFTKKLVDLFLENWEKEAFLNTTSADYVSLKKQFLKSLDIFAELLLGKNKSFKKEIKDNAENIIALILQFSERMALSVSLLLNKEDPRTSRNIIKCLNYLGNSFPLNYFQINYFIQQLSSQREKFLSDSSLIAQEFSKICESYRFSLMKRKDEKEYLHNDLLRTLFNKTRQPISENEIVEEKVPKKVKKIRSDEDKKKRKKKNHKREKSILSKRSNQEFENEQNKKVNKKDTNQKLEIKLKQFSKD